MSSKTVALATTTIPRALLGKTAVTAYWTARRTQDAENWTAAGASTAPQHTPAAEHLTLFERTLFDAILAVHAASQPHRAQVDRFLTAASSSTPPL